MKRDLALIKKILAYIESQDGAANSSAVGYKCGTGGQFDTDHEKYQIWLLIDGGFLNATKTGSWGESDYILTWSGHNLLERLNAGQPVY